MVRVPGDGVSSMPTDEVKQAVIAQYLGTSYGRRYPWCTECNSSGIGGLHGPKCSKTPRRRPSLTEIARDIFVVEQLPEGALPVYSRDPLAAISIDPEFLELPDPCGTDEGEHATPGLPPGTRVRLRHGNGPSNEGEIVEEKTENGGYLVKHDGEIPGPLGWSYHELEVIEPLEQPGIDIDNVKMPWE